MRRLDRLTISSRVFCVAAILGLSLALFDPVALRGTLLLGAISAVAIATEYGVWLSRPWIALAEGALAALIVGVMLPGGLVLLPYLAVPALVAGLRAGTRAVMALLAVEAAALAGVFLLFAEVDTQFVSAVLLPWLLASLGLGLMGAWLRQFKNLWGSDTDASYEAARRLLTQLRTVARRLSSGLDPVGIAHHALGAVDAKVTRASCGLFVRTDGGVLAPLAYMGPGAKDRLAVTGPAIDKCWRSMGPVQEAQAAGDASRRSRVVFPLRSGERMIGIIICDSVQSISRSLLEELQREVDEHAVRLDTALAFDEVRSVATVEERKRLAREIHDGVAQEIASLGYVVDDLSATATTDVQRRKLSELRSELTRVVSELRLSIFDLKSEVSGGLGSALSDYIQEIGARSGMTVHLTLDEAPTRLRPEVETELLRIAQEAVTNARKHSGARNLWVDCRIRPPHATLSIADDGLGLGSARDDSFGIGIMQERAERIGAALEISSNPSAQSLRGTKVTVTVGKRSHFRITDEMEHSA